MKKLIMLSALALTTLAAGAQTVEGSNFGDNWSLGLKGGAVTPLKGHSFFENMRGQAGIDLRKQITPVVGLGVEGTWGVNTSDWHIAGPQSSTAFDSQYVGVYTAVNLNNLFAGYAGTPRVFEVEGVAGAGWGHFYRNKEVGPDWNFMATKAGLNFNFNLGESKAWTIGVQPRVVWNMSDAKTRQSSASYDSRKAAFELSAAVTYHFQNSNGTHSFVLAGPACDPAEIDALNAQINSLRAEVAGLAAANVDCMATNAALAADLDACMNRPVQTVTKTETKTYNTLNSVRYVFFKIGSSVITPDQQPNVEMIAQYLKNHPKAKVLIKGYASPDGPEDVNIRLANDRAQSVKNSLVNKYKISADRIQAEGEGIGHMFSEESWNRVSICTIED